MISFKTALLLSKFKHFFLFSGSDYQLETEVLTFTPQDMMLQVQVTIFADEIVEPTEEFVLSLSIPSNTSRIYSVGSIPEFRMQIRDDDGIDR